MPERPKREGSQLPLRSGLSDDEHFKPRRTPMPNCQEILDRLKLLAVQVIFEEIDTAVIRARSLANRDRWNAAGTWILPAPP